MAMSMSRRTSCVLLILLFHIASTQLVAFCSFDLFHPFGTDAASGNDLSNENKAEVAVNPGQGGPIPNAGGDEFPMAYKGGWEVVCENSGVSAMHLQIFPITNKAIMFDTTVLGPSQIALPPNVECRPDPNLKNGADCWAHAVEYDIDTARIRPLKVLTDTWCSGGVLDQEGRLVQHGGFNDGGAAVRYLQSCPKCDWKEYQISLSGKRWYASTATLADGRFICVGGRRMFNYEYVPAEGKTNTPEMAYALPLLEQTTDPNENNLYPFVFLSTDGNVFIFANSRSILLDPNTNKVIKEFPNLPGGSRNYPGSGMSAILPLVFDGFGENDVVPSEVIVCGGGQPEAFSAAEKQNQFLPALQDCARIKITDPNPAWDVEMMPSPRVMGDMLILPTGDLLILNGAKKGASGWQFAEEPNYVATLYKPNKPKGERFLELQPTKIPRMYHSSSAVLIDGKILVAGSNTNNMYNFTGVKYPTEVRVEKFMPHYMDPKLPASTLIKSSFKGKPVAYGANFDIEIKVASGDVKQADLKVTIYYPPFTTHGYSMNQRMILLPIRKMAGTLGDLILTVTAPPNTKIASAGYYMLFVIYKGQPSNKGEWIQIKNLA